MNLYFNAFWLLCWALFLPCFDLISDTWAHSLAHSVINLCVWVFFFCNSHCSSLSFVLLLLLPLLFGWTQFVDISLILMTIQAAYRNKSARKCSISLCAAKWIYWDWINLNWRYNVKKAHIQSLVSNGATLISSWMEMALGALSEFDLLFLILWIHFLGYCKMTWYLIPRVNEIKLLGLGACLYKYFWIFEHLRVLIMIDHLIFGPRERKTQKLKGKNCTLESWRFKFQECMYTCVSGDGFEFRFGLILFFFFIPMFPLLPFSVSKLLQIYCH